MVKQLSVRPEAAIIVGMVGGVDQQIFFERHSNRYRYWHTAEDTPDKLTPKSLERVGGTLYNVAPVPRQLFAQVWS